MRKARLVRGRASLGNLNAAEQAEHDVKGTLA